MQTPSVALLFGLKEALRGLHVADSLELYMMCFDYDGSYLLK